MDSPVCTICLEAVVQNNGRSTARLNCSHVFHLDCIGSEFNARGVMQCPNCRATEDGQWLFAGGDPEEDILSEEEEEVMEMPLFYSNVRQLPNDGRNLRAPYALPGASNNITVTSHHPYAATVTRSVLGAGFGALPLLQHPPEYQALPQAHTYSYQRTNAPIIRNIRASELRPPPRLARVPVYGPMGAANIVSSGLQLQAIPYVGPRNGVLGPVVFISETTESYGCSMFRFV